MAAEAAAPTEREFRRLYDTFPQLRAAVSECQELERQQWTAEATARHDAIVHDDCTLRVDAGLELPVFVNRLGTEVKYNNLTVTIVPRTTDGARVVSIKRKTLTLANLVCTAVHKPATEGRKAQHIYTDAGDAGYNLRWATQAELQIGIRHKRSSEPAMVD